MSNVGALRLSLEHLPADVLGLSALARGALAQGAGAADVVAGFDERGRGALVNSSRGILYAWRERQGVGWRDAARDAAASMAEEIRAALAGRA